MRPVNPSRSPRGAAPSERALARVDELLARDVEDAFPEPAPELRERIDRALSAAPRRATSLRRTLALAAAAALLVAVGALTLRALLHSEPAAPQRDGPPVALRAPARLGLDRLLGQPAVRLHEPLEAPLYDQARRLAADGQRVASSLVASLPSPLRRSLERVR